MLTHQASGAYTVAVPEPERGRDKVLKVVYGSNQFNKGDLVTVKGSRNEAPFCIIALKTSDHQQVAVLKALFNDTYIIEKPVSELKSFLIRGKL